MNETESLLFWERVVIDINNGEYVEYRTPVIERNSLFEREKECLFCSLSFTRGFGVIKYYGGISGAPKPERWYVCADCFKKKTFFRAANDIICNVCNREYRVHPEASIGLPWLRCLCDGQLVKL
jgi:hypothetical protein